MVKYLLVIISLSLICVLTACGAPAKINYAEYMDEWSEIFEYQGHTWLVYKGNSYDFNHHPDCLMRDIRKLLQESETAAKQPGPRDRKCGRNNAGKCVSFRVDKQRNR